MKKMHSISISDQSKIIHAFEKRHGKKYSNGEVYVEYRDDLPNLIILVKKYRENIEYDPLELMKKNIADSLDQLIEYFK